MKIIHNFYDYSYYYYYWADWLGFGFVHVYDLVMRIECVAIAQIKNKQKKVKNRTAKQNGIQAKLQIAVQSHIYSVSFGERVLRAYVRIS